MGARSKLMAIVLVICGTACILVPLCGIFYLYDEHATSLAMPNPSGQVLTNELRFAVFLGMPSMVAFIFGGVLVAIGVQSARE